MTELFNEGRMVVVLVTTATVIAVILFHYEALAALNRWCQRGLARPDSSGNQRKTIVVVMMVLLLVHVMEIWLFGLSYWWLLDRPGMGGLAGYDELSLLDCVYFSAATYSTVGWGELVAHGNIRFLAGTEALLGFLMITWTASFSYLIMDETWRR